MFDPISFWGSAVFLVVVVLLLSLFVVVVVVVSYIKEKDGKFMFKIQIKSLVYSPVLSSLRERSK